MTVIVNGEERVLADQATMQILIMTLGLEEKVMAAAVNMEIVKQEAWDTYQLKEGDKVELLDFVGGG